MQVADNHIVAFHYTLTSADGEVIDESQEQPLAYLHGQGQLLAGLENALAGKSAGDGFEVELGPDQAYGEFNQDLVQVVPRSAFQGIDTIEVGMEFEAQGEGGERMVTVVEVAENEVTVDANHPLAGQTLNFAIEVVEVRQATQEELDHGHAHGPGGHQH